MSSKDYFLSGSAEELIHDSMRGFDRSGRSTLLADCLWCLLDQQFVESGSILGLWKVVTGSGQGLGHSGDLADWALYLKAEKNWAMSQEVIDKYHVKGFFQV